MTNPVIEHETIQPLPKFIKRHKDDRECPTCGGRMTRRSKQCIDCAWRRPEIPQPENHLLRHIPLTLGMYAVVDFDLYDWLMQWKWAAKVGNSRRKTYYAVRTQWINGKCYFVQMHRLIMGVTDPAIEVDHRNPLETLNNTRANLRLATPGQNQANRLYIENSSGYKGVAIVKKKPGKRRYDGWRGEITVNGVRTVSPIYRDREPAARWYDSMARKHFGEYARTNFSEEGGHSSYPPPP